MVTDKSVSKLVNVHELDLYGTIVTDESVSKLVNVHTLKLWGTNVTDECIKILKYNGCIIYNYCINYKYSRLYHKCKKKLKKIIVICIYL